MVETLKQFNANLNKHCRYRTFCSFLSYYSITVYPKKYAHGFCFAVLCCSYTLTDFPISIRLTSLALWHCNDCPSASKATLMNMDIYFMWIQYERLHNHNKATHNKTVSICLRICCTLHYMITIILANLKHPPPPPPPLPGEMAAISLRFVPWGPIICNPALV